MKILLSLFLALIAQLSSASEALRKLQGSGNVFMCGGRRCVASTQDCVNGVCVCKQGFIPKPSLYSLIFGSNAGCVGEDECLRTGDNYPCPAVGSFCQDRDPDNFRYKCGCLPGYTPVLYSSDGSTVVDRDTGAVLPALDGIPVAYRPITCVATPTPTNAPVTPTLAPTLHTPGVQCTRVCTGPGQVCDAVGAPNAQGLYPCSCSGGWKPTISGGGCVDIQQCADPNLNDCGPGALCVEIKGGLPGFDCICPTGWIGGPRFECIDPNNIRTIIVFLEYFYINALRLLNAVEIPVYEKLALESATTAGFTVVSANLFLQTFVKSETSPQGYGNLTTVIEYTVITSQREGRRRLFSDVDVANGILGQTENLLDGLTKEPEIRDVFSGATIGGGGVDGTIKSRPYEAPSPTPAPTPAPTAPPVVAAATTTTTTTTTLPPCTGVVCATDATCEVATGKCLCDTGFSGDGNVRCVPKNDVAPPGVIFGSGNANGFFTTDRSQGVELALRAKVRFDWENNPRGESLRYAFDGDRTYTFYAGLPPVGYYPANPALIPNTPRWNIDWSVNSDYLENVTKLDDLVYSFSLDCNTSAAVTPCITPGDHINPPDATTFYDHAIDDNGGGGPFTAANSTEYTNFIASYNVAQNSLNYLFLYAINSGIDPTVPGIYTVEMSAFDPSNTTTPLASTSIDVVILNDKVFPNVIFGSGNANGGYTTTRANGVELGLRAKLRFDRTASCGPTNTFNFNSDGTYDFPSGFPPSPYGFSWAKGDDATAYWNFEWSVNTDYAGSTGNKLDDLTYELSLDYNATQGTTFYSFDPIEPTPSSSKVHDHSLGDNSFAAGTGIEATASWDVYEAAIAMYNVAQNSWNYAFFSAPALNTTNIDFNASVPGVFTISLKAFKDGTEVAAVSIDVFTSAGPGC